MQLIKKLAEKYGLSKDDFWELERSGRHIAWILKHDACVKIAKLSGIVFEKPEIVEHSRDHCILYGEGFKPLEGDDIPTKEIRVWTFGEADCANNCKAPYPYAMAEKRLQDRLTLKIEDCYEYGIYSEIEADAFKRSDEQPKPPSMPQTNGIALKRRKKPPTDKEVAEVEKLVLSEYYSDSQREKILDYIHSDNISGKLAEDLLDKMRTDVSIYNAEQKSKMEAK